MFNKKYKTFNSSSTLKQYILLPAFLLLISFCQVTARFRMAPYLQSSVLGRVTVMAETDSKDNVIVIYNDSNSNISLKAKTEFYVPTTKQDSYVHRIILDNLEPDKKYFYKVVDKNDTSETFSFHSVVSDKAPFRFAIMGDCRSNPQIHSLMSVCLKNQNPLISIYTGDLCSDGKYGSWKKEFFVPSEQELISSVPFFNALGNHEAMDMNNAKAFTQAPESKSGNQFYYSFDFGDIHFLILNTYESCKKGSKQYEFAENDLKNTDKKWKIAVFHNSAYVGGGHGENMEMIAVTKEIFEPNKVVLVLTGHSHFYQRNEVNGITHLVVGGGGAPLYTILKKDYTIVSNQDYTYGIIDYTPGELSAKIYDIRDKLVDSFVLKSKRKI